MAIRVLLVDDHALVRDGLKSLIDSEPDLEVVGEAGSEEDAVRVVTAIAADIALVDVSLPGGGGVKLTEQLLSIVPTLKVIGVTRHSEHAFVAQMLSAGASGYVLKQSPSSELLRAIRAVAAGDRFVDPALHRDAAGDRRQIRQDEYTASDEPLAAREEQVLRLVAKTHSNEEIAGLLAMSVGEVADLKSRAMKKAGLMSRLQVIAYAESRRWH